MMIWGRMRSKLVVGFGCKEVSDGSAWKPKTAMMNSRFQNCLLAELQATRHQREREFNEEWS